MKILIVEDNPMHQKAAKEQLKDHELTIISSFVEFFQAVEKTRKKPAKINLSEFDAVLTDINLPSPHDKLGVVSGATGFIVVLKAIEAQVKFIGAISDLNHHDDVHSKAMDLWLGPKPVFTTGNSRVCLNSYRYLSCDCKLWDSLLEDLSKEVTE